MQALRARVAARAAEGPHARPDPRRSALLLVEFQGEWLAPAGLLRRGVARDPAALDAAADRASAAVEAARGAGMPVVHSGLAFQPGHPELGGRGHYGLRAAQPIAGLFRAGTPGAAFAPPFEPRPGDWVAAGRTGASAFAGSNLDALLRANGVQALFVAGFATEVCVEGTLRQAHDLGYDAVVLEDACAGITAEAHRHCLENAVPHFGHRSTVDAFRAALARRRDPA